MHDPNTFPQDLKEAKDLKPPLPPQSPEPSAPETDGEKPPPVCGKASHAQVSACSRPSPMTSWFLETVDQNPSMSDVFNPMRCGNIVVPLRSSALCFHEIAKAIEGAKESVDIVTMGIDTDMRLIRNNLNQRNRILKYKRAYPAEPEDPADGSPDRHSYVLSDLLTRVSREEHRDPVTKEMRDPIKVRILAAAPRSIGNCFHDPLHFWYRCKRFKYLGEDDPYKNITFAVRSGKGVNVKPPDEPELDTENLSIWERMKIAGCNGLDALAKILLQVGFIYQWAFTHHQKLIVIDINQPDAKAFVIGSNLNEEYWDDPSHLLYNPLRMPYAPWRDVGLWVQGPVLHDIAQNIKENWQVMVKTDGEVLPEELIADGIRAERSGMLREDDDLSPNVRPPKNNFDFSLYHQLLEFAPLMGAALGLGKGDPLKVLAVCAGLATAIDMVNGLLTGTLLLDTSAIKKETGWGGERENEGKDFEDYEVVKEIPHPDPEGQYLSVQFDRTFCQEGTPEDFSVRHGLYRAVSKAGQDSLIYIENQYFRDMHFVTILKSLVAGFPQGGQVNANQESGSIKPNVIIVTSDTGQSFEGIFSSGPTYKAYRLLEECGVNFLFCKLRTREHGPPQEEKEKKIVFQDPRHQEGMGMRLLGGALDKLKFLLVLSPLALLLVRGRLKNLRDTLWAAIPALFYAARQGAGPTGGMPRLSAKNLEPILSDVDKVATLLTTLKGSNSPLAELARKMRDNPGKENEYIPQIIRLLGGEGGVPAFPDKIELDSDTAQNTQIRKALKRETPQGVPVPETPKKDPGNIYVHSKAIIVNSLFSLLGSANHNERSMWHDSEAMLAVAGYTPQDFPGKLQKELMHTVLSGDLPEGFSGVEVFDHFLDHLMDNVAAYSEGRTQPSLVFPYLPEAAYGSGVFT